MGGLREIMIDGVNGSLVADDDFEGRRARVPYDVPAAVAATADRL